MKLDLMYYYGNTAEQYSFYRIPKALFTDAHFQGVSMEAKLLYGLMLDRMGLSIRNGWLDSDGKVYIFFTLEDAMKMMGWGHNKGVRHFAKLEQIGLIERVNQEELPAEQVRGRLLKLDMTHIAYALDVLIHAAAPVGNVRGYLLSVLYNAPMVMEQYYDAQVNHDMGPLRRTGG